MRGEDSGNYAAFFADYEGLKHLSNSSDSDTTYDNPDEREAAISISYLINQAFLYKVTGNNIHTPYVHDNENALMKTAIKLSKAQPTVISPDHDLLTAAEQFFIEDRYSNYQFQGILPDTGASEFSTAGKGQFLALQREDPLITLDTRQAGIAQVKFGKGDAMESIGSVNVKTPIGKIIFHILKAFTPFLMSLRNMDRLKVYVNNVTNEILFTNGKRRAFLIRKWGHPWFYVSKLESAAFLTNIKLRKLYRWFGHPATDRLCKMLERAGYNIHRNELKVIEKFCNYCQMKNSKSLRFKFTIKNDCEFNYKIFVNVLHLISKLVLHIID
jgi:hypothetical protein